MRKRMAGLVPLSVSLMSCSVIVSAPAAPAAPPAVIAAPVYLLPSQADMLELLGPPPAVDSAAQRQDLQAVIDAQRAAHREGTISHAVADADLNCSHIADVLGDDAAVSRDPGVLLLLNGAAREAAALSGSVKMRYRRTRPFATSHEVEPLADMATSAANSTATRNLDTGGAAAIAPGVAGPAAATDLQHSSYPSGHSTFGTVCAILLADMVPEQRQALFERGLDYAHSRMVVGAHFPTDLEAGRLIGTVSAQLLLQNAGFLRDFERARVSLRVSLRLSASVADGVAVH